jgi:hypothetical protein
VATREDEGFVEGFYTDLAKGEVAHVFDVFLEGGEQVGGRHGGREGSIHTQKAMMCADGPGGEMAPEVMDLQR